MVPFWDCLRITLSKIPRGFEGKLGHLQTLNQGLAEHMSITFLNLQRLEGVPSALWAQCAASQ